MTKPQPMTEDEVLALVMAEFEAADIWASDLGTDRERALDYYYGRPQGDEQEGRSQVISSDVADVVEWLMPDLVRTFASDDELIAFEPSGQDDTQAKIATKYAHHVLFTENDGFRLIHDSLKDGLLSKTGAMKWRWVEKKEPIDRDYDGLSDIQLALLLQGLAGDGDEGDIQIIGQEAETQPDGSVTYNVRVRMMREWSQVEIETIPPDELRIPRTAHVVDDSCRYIGHKISGKTRSDLIAEGLDPSVVMDLPKDDDIQMFEKSARFSGIYAPGTPSQNKMMEPVDYVEHYVLADVDGDGIAERRLVCTSGNKILRNEVLSGLPIAAWSPVRVPHAAIGRSIADRIMDIQRIMTALMRGTLDNIYTVNAGGRYQVVSGQVNMDDLLTVRPGGIVRSKSLDSLRPLPVEYIGDKAMSVMEMVRTMREERTGVNKHSQGLNAETLHQTATGTMAILNQGDQLKELLCRLYAEFCLKRVFSGILDLTVRYQDSAKQIRVAGEVLNVDPSQFKERFSMRVKVGSGNARKQEKIAALGNILSSQAEARAAGIGIVGIDQIYNATADMTELVGFRPSRYWVDPKSPEGQKLNQPQQPQTNPLVEAEIVKSKARMQEAAQQDNFDRKDRILDHAEWATEQTLKFGVPVPGSTI